MPPVLSTRVLTALVDTFPFCIEGESYLLSVPYFSYFWRSRVYNDLSKITPRAPVTEISVKGGQGMAEWFNWLRDRRGASASDARKGNTI